MVKGFNSTKLQLALLLKRIRDKLLKLRISGRWKQLVRRIYIVHMNVMLEKLEREMVDKVEQMDKMKTIVLFRRKKVRV